MTLTPGSSGNTRNVEMRSTPGSSTFCKLKIERMSMFYTMNECRDFRGHEHGLDGSC